MEQGKVSSIDIGFPAEVINSLQVLGPQSWDLIYATIEKLVKENRLEQAIEDLEHLMNDKALSGAFIRSLLLFSARGVQNINEQFLANLPDKAQARTAQWCRIYSSF